MVVTLESTSKLVELNGVPVRIWEGRTESGIPVIAFVTRIAVEQGQTPAVCEQFERELRQVRSPSAAAEAFPARLVL